MAEMYYSPVDIARQFRFVREASANRGLRVEAIQKWSAGQAGDSWCAEFATMVLDICFQGAAPVPRLQAVQDIYNIAKKEGWVVDDPEMNDLVLTVNAEDHAHHIAIVCTVEPELTAIAGNTSEDGTSSNGDRVAEHKISTTNKVFVRYPQS